MVETRKSEKMNTTSERWLRSDFHLPMEWYWKRRGETGISKEKWEAGWFRSYFLYINLLGWLLWQGEQKKNSIFIVERFGISRHIAIVLILSAT